ncbi:GDP-L-fucose synthase [Candidatus Kaiserbacteria bacterium]|nr:GDP-L-fucose synthase [Candidatus Kaiserbacteria bacterium]
MEKNSKIYVAGHRGLVGSSIVRELERKRYTNIIVRTHDELDLLDPIAVRAFFETERPEYVFLAAARVGGIMANNTYPADFIRENLIVQTNVLHEAYKSGVKKLLFLGSSCIYPKLAPQPIKEEYLMTGPLEETNSAYAMAKIAGIEMCQAYHRQYGCNFISVMPTNLYGPNDNFSPERSHVLPALIRRFHEAKMSDAPTVTVWGTGAPKREFLHVDDLGSACVFLMETYDDPSIINIGTGEDVTIRELAELIAATVGYNGKIVWDKTKPDGTPQKKLDVSKIHALGWKHTIPLEQGLASTYVWFKNSFNSA